MRLIILFILILFSSIAYAKAEVKSVNAVAAMLEQAVRNSDAAMCYKYSTARSHPYVKRALSYQLQQLVPKNIRYGTPKLEGEKAFLRASVRKGEQEDYITLVFVREKDHGKPVWKLDFPHTMQQGLGDDWEQQLAQMEQLYLIMKTQSGGNNKELLKLFRP
jgi:hypothetical protein